MSSQNSSQKVVSVDEQAFYVVNHEDGQFEVTAYRVFWFGLDDVATTASPLTTSTFAGSSTR